jgi:hypothetical protein
LYEIIIPNHIEKKLERYGNIKERFYKKVNLFKQNPSHPSLRFKIYEGVPNTFEISVNISFRVLLKKIGERRFEIVDIGYHDILDKYGKK